MKKVLVFVAALFAVSSVWGEASWDDLDQRACNYARTVGSQSVWQNYLERFPNGICSFEAENEIENLKNGGSKRNSPESSVVVINNEPVRYYKPYKASGTALLVIGLLADLVVADGLIIGGVANGSVGMFVAGIGVGIVGFPMWISGAVLLSKEEPVPSKNEKIELSNVSLAPTKGGMFASLGFKF